MNGSQAGDTGPQWIITGREELPTKLACAERQKEVGCAHGDLGEPRPVHTPEAGGNVTSLQRSKEASGVEGARATLGVHRAQVLEAPETVFYFGVWVPFRGFEQSDMIAVLFSIILLAAVKRLEGRSKAGQGDCLRG